MAHGKKTGGGRRGSANGETLDVAERLKALRCDPIEGMARIAMDTGAPLDLRARMFAQLAQYVAPKRKAVEHSADAHGWEALLERIALPPKAP